MINGIFKLLFSPPGTPIPDEMVEAWHQEHHKYPRLYVSGPMTGLPDLNFPAFIAATTKLRSMGFEVISPVEINDDKNAKWEDCLKRDIEELMKCDSIVLLDGWHLSDGTQLEMHIAHRVGMGILFYKDMVKPEC